MGFICSALSRKSMRRRATALILMVGRGHDKDAFARYHKDGSEILVGQEGKTP